MKMKEMKFRTEIEPINLSTKVSYEGDIFAIGSCFAERIGSQLSSAKLPIVVNPTGVLFNPASIAATIERLANCRFVAIDELHPFDEQDEQGGWFHYDFHSSLSAPTANETVERINAAIAKSHEALKRAEVVIVTLGTAWVYELEESGEIVANCHKRPSREFVHRRLSVDETAEMLCKMVATHLAGKRVIFTVSPIRHIADGLADNSLSKATLRLAIAALEGEPMVEYFPAYEMMADDLRDYRFYESDMVHPSPQATEYIFAKFCEATMSEKTIQTMQRVEQIVRAAQHRPQNAGSKGYKELCERQLGAIEELQRANPKVDMSSEKDYFVARLR